MNEPNLHNKNARLVVKLLLIVVGMFGFGFALVPLYNIFCDITGVNAKVGVAAVAEQSYVIDPSREITLEFVTSVNQSTPLKFGSEVAKMKVVPGQSYRVNFWAENLMPDTLIAQAIPSVTPGLASQYLKKTECFCFSQQDFRPGETRVMPVQFVIDPKLPESYRSVTLAYTFFDVTDEKYRTH